MIKKYVLPILTAVVCVCFIHTQTVFADDLRVVVSDESIKEVNSEMYGLDFTFSSLSNFVNDDLSINQDVIQQFEGYPIANSRMMGTASRYFRWKNSIGPYDERGYMGYYSFVREKVGIIEWIKIIRAIDADATFTFSLNLETDTAANAADLAEFLTGDGTVNYNGGINWAAKRIELGIEEPVSVIWELGNETDQSSFNLIYNFSSKDYVKVAKKYISAIREIDPDAEFAAHSATNTLAFTNPEEQIENRTSWNRTVLTELQDDIDYFIFHCYGNISQNVLKLEYNLDFAISDMKEVLKPENSERIKLYFTEFSVYADTDATNARGYQLEGGLVVAEMLNRMLVVPEIERANYHNFMNPHTRAAFYQSSDGVYKTSVMGDVMKLYANYGVGTALSSKLQIYHSVWYDYYKATAQAGITNVVIKNDNKYRIFVCNQEKNAHKLRFSLPDGSYRLVSKAEITGPELTSSNWYSGIYPDVPETNDVSVTYTTPNTDIVSDTSLVDVPKYSITMFELEKQ